MAFNFKRTQDIAGQFCIFGKLPRRGDVRTMVELLVTEEDHFPPEKRIAHRLHLRLRQRTREVDATDLGA